MKNIEIIRTDMRLEKYTFSNIEELENYFESQDYDILSHTYNEYYGDMLVIDILGSDGKECSIYWEYRLVN